MTSYLIVSSRVSNNKEAWLSECLLDLIGERPWSESPSHRNSTSVVCKLEDSSLCECVCMHMCTCVCVRASMCVCMCACVCTCMKRNIKTNMVYWLQKDDTDTTQSNKPYKNIDDCTPPVSYVSELIEMRTFNHQILPAIIVYTDLSILPVREDTHIRWVLHSCNNSGSQK